MFCYSQPVWERTPSGRRFPENRIRPIFVGNPAPSRPNGIPNQASAPNYWNSTATIFPRGLPGGGFFASCSAGPPRAPAAQPRRTIPNLPGAERVPTPQVSPGPPFSLRSSPPLRNEPPVVAQGPLRFNFGNKTKPKSTAGLSWPAPSFSRNPASRRLSGRFFFCLRGRCLAGRTLTMPLPRGPFEIPVPIPARDSASGALFPPEATSQPPPFFWRPPTRPMFSHPPPPHPPPPPDLFFAPSPPRVFPPRTRGGASALPGASKALAKPPPEWTSYRVPPQLP